MPEDLPQELADRLARIAGVVAVALGGSRARGTHRPDSDIDLGLYYRDASPFSIADIRALAGEINDAPEPVVTDFYRWGPWVNGGAWLTVRGRRVDLLYRELERIEKVIDDCRRGAIESDFYQQPPYGFHSYVYLGELSICRPLHDPQDVLARLKERLVPYPPALQKAIVDRFLWAAEFDLAQARAVGERGDVYAAAGCLTRVASHLVQVLYALNERYFLSDRGALTEIGSFRVAPSGFASAVSQVLAHPGAGPAELAASTSRLAAVLRQTTELCGPLYTPPDFRGAGAAAAD